MTFADRPKLIKGRRGPFAPQRWLTKPRPICENAMYVCKNAMYVSSENPMVGATVYSSAEGVLLANSQRSSRNPPDSDCPIPGVATDLPPCDPILRWW